MTDDLLVVVTTDPHASQETMVHVPLAKLGIGDDEPYVVRRSAHRRALHAGAASRNYVRLDPSRTAGPRRSASSADRAAIARRIADARSIHPPTLATNDPLWYKDAIIYQLHVKSFRDSQRATASATFAG